jgi:hypothetical protein
MWSRSGVTLLFWLLLMLLHPKGGASSLLEISYLISLIPGSSLRHLVMEVSKGKVICSDGPLNTCTTAWRCLRKWTTKPFIQQSASCISRLTTRLTVPANTCDSLRVTAPHTCAAGAEARATPLYKTVMRHVMSRSMLSFSATGGNSAVWHHHPMTPCVTKCMQCSVIRDMWQDLYPGQCNHMGYEYRHSCILTKQAQDSCVFCIPAAGPIAACRKRK